MFFCIVYTSQRSLYSLVTNSVVIEPNLHFYLTSQLLRHGSSASSSNSSIFFLDIVVFGQTYLTLLRHPLDLTAVPKQTTCYKRFVSFKKQVFGKKGVESSSTSTQHCSALPLQAERCSPASLTVGETLHYAHPENSFTCEVNKLLERPH